MSHEAVDLEQGGVDHHRRRHHLPHHSRSIDGSDVSDGEGSCYSQFYSTTGGSYDGYTFEFVVVSDGNESLRASSVSNCSSLREVNNNNNGNNNNNNNNDNKNESGVCEIKANLGTKVERDCRICHMGLESNSQESGAPIQLGCSCKDDLGSAHKNCAEAWFKIKGNKTCEICQSIARNITGVSEIEFTEVSNESHSITMAAIAATMPSSEPRGFWHGHRFLNFLLVCMVFAFVVSWLFHFTVST